jgi:hypothetical protein
VAPRGLWKDLNTSGLRDALRLDLELGQNPVLDGRF